MPSAALRRRGANSLVLDGVEVEVAVAGPFDFFLATGAAARRALGELNELRVVRYYLPPGRRESVEAAGAQCETRQRVLILSGAEVLAPAQLAALRDCDPLLVAQLRLVEVRKR